MPVHTVAIGDSLTPVGCQILPSDSDTPVDLTGLTVKMLVTNLSGTTVVEETTTGVTVVDESTGKVSYDLPTAVNGTAGHYYLNFRVYSGTERDTYPSPIKQQRMQVDVVNP